MVPSAENSRRLPSPAEYAAISKTSAMPRSRGRLPSSISRPRSTARAVAFTRLTCSSSTAFKTPARAALRNTRVPNSAGSPAQARRSLRAGNGAACATSEAMRSAKSRHGGRRKRGMQGDVIRLRKKLRQWNQFRAPFGGAFRADVWIVGQYAHLEGPCAARYLRAHTAEADQAQRLAAKFGAGRAGFLPFAG